MQHRLRPDCLDEDAIIRYLENAVSDEEKKGMEGHINECAACFDELAALTATLFSKEDFEEFEQSYKPPAKAEIRRFLKYAKQESKTASDPSLLKKFGLFWEEVRKRWSGKIPAPVLRFAVLTVFLAPTGFWGFRYYQTDYQISQARMALIQNARIYFAGEARLSGAYKASLSDKDAIMGKEDNRKAYLKEADARLNKALKNGADEVETLRLLAQTALLSGATAKADSLLRLILKKGEVDAAVYNDLGVISFKQKNDLQADHYFSKAVDTDSTRSEFLYNLAWTKARTGQNKIAKALFNKCLTLEKSDLWHKAIKSALAKL